VKKGVSLVPQNAMRAASIIPCFVAGAVLLAACGNPHKAHLPFEVRERSLITMSDSVMYVSVVDDVQDSLVLRGPCKDFTEEELRSELFPMLAAKMLATVCSPQQDGVGLAAPQVGLKRRLAVVQRLDKEGEPFEVYPNLRILEYLGGTVRGSEGCLSLPPYRGEVPRREGVVVSWTDPQTLQSVTDTVRGYTAIIFQHEADHLDGILYSDRAGALSSDPDWEAERAPFVAAGAYEKPVWLQ